MTGAPTLTRKELLALSPTHGAAALAKVDGAPKPKGKRVNIYAPYRNALEKHYARYLESARLCGYIHRWEYEPDRIPLGGGAVFTPDFKVWTRPDVYEYRETKGYWREAAKVRIKVASSRCPGIPFRVIKLIRGQWIPSETFLR